VKRFAVIAAAVSLALIAGAVACGEGTDSMFGGGADSGADGNSSLPGFDGGLAESVVVLHAAAFPAMRLCFENYPELPPLPDDALMPEANVVGVEVGSFARIPALEKAPGKVWVIDQRDVRATPRAPGERKCGALLADRDFSINRKYQLGGHIDKPLGVGQVDMLAITGCGGGAWLQELGVSPTDCTDYDSTSGSLVALSFPLVPSDGADETTLPVQVIHMSPLLEKTRAPGEQLELTFGELETSPDGRLPQGVSSAPPLYELGSRAMLHLDQSSQSVYGSHGFRIALRSLEAGAPSAATLDASAADASAPASFLVDQALAEVQELSFPQLLPNQYFRPGSSWVLLVLGDPRIARRLADGGLNSQYDARRGVHLVAIPVKKAPENAATSDASAEPLDAASDQ
jgi:hypothetical protein